MRVRQRHTSRSVVTRCSRVRVHGRARNSRLTASFPMTALHSGQWVPPCPTVNRTKHVRHMEWLHGSTAADGPLCSRRQMGQRVFIVQWYFKFQKKLFFFMRAFLYNTPRPPSDVHIFQHTHDCSQQSRALNAPVTNHGCSKLPSDRFLPSRLNPTASKLLVTSSYESTFVAPKK